MSEKEILEEKSKIVCYLVDVFGGTDSDIIDRVPNYIIDKIVDDYFENDEEIRKLKQQLAEKDKEIEELQQQLKEKDEALEYYFGLSQAQITEIDTFKQKLEEKDREIIVLKEALELATENSDNYWEEKMAIENRQCLYDYFIQRAKESIDENRN